MAKIIWFILLVFSQAFSEVHPPDEVKKLASQFKTTMLDCPDKIWADFNWKDLKVVFVYPKKTQSWVWDASENSIASIANSTLSATEMESTYNFFKHNGKDALSLKMGDKDFTVFELGVHEFFHNQGQKTWQSEKQSKGRATNYPLAWQPRVYRRMLFENLKSYFESKQESNLRKAKFWFDKWSTEYPSESRDTTDGYEGSAQYVEGMATSIDMLGCQASEEQLKTDALKRVKESYGRSFSGDTLALDSEGYSMGSLAALILRFTPGQNLSQWNQQVAKGKTPVEILLASVQGQADVAPAAIVKLFQGKVENNNAHWATYLEPIISNWTNPDYIQIGGPSEWLQSNFLPYMFAYSEKIEKTMSPVWGEQKFRSPDGSSEYTSSKESVLVMHYTSACTNARYFMLVPRSSVVESNGIFQVNSRYVSGKIKGKIHTDGQGLNYICPQ